MVLLAGMVAVIVSSAVAASAQTAPLVPCQTLHLKVNGTGPAQCRSKLIQLEDADFLVETILVPVPDGTLNVAREYSASNFAFAQELTVWMVADILGKFLRTEGWGHEWHSGNYVVRAFRGIATHWQGQCVAFVWRSSELAGGYREQVMGVYCTHLPAPIDYRIAEDVLLRIAVK